MTAVGGEEVNILVLTSNANSLKILLNALAVHLLIVIVERKVCPKIGKSPFRRTVSFVVMTRKKNHEFPGMESVLFVILRDEQSALQSNQQDKMGQTSIRVFEAVPAEQIA